MTSQHAESKFTFFTFTNNMLFVWLASLRVTLEQDESEEKLRSLIRDKLVWEILHIARLFL